MRTTCVDSSHCHHRRSDVAHTVLASHFPAGDPRRGGAARHRPAVCTPAPPPETQQYVKL
eukprot:9475535-Pyramimonas_sp.AAC.1